jgi:hypothetical protein
VAQMPPQFSFSNCRLLTHPPREIPLRRIHRAIRASPNTIVVSVARCHD